MNVFSASQTLEMGSVQVTVPHTLDSTLDVITQERFLLCELATAKTPMKGMLLSPEYTVNMY